MQSRIKRNFDLKSELIIATFALPGTIVSGILMYVILSFLSVPLGINIPFSIIIAAITLGLTNYYSKPDKEDDEHLHFRRLFTLFGIISKPLFFVILYGIMLSSSLLFFGRDQIDLYMPWQELGVQDVIGIVSGLLLTSFLPGYAVISILDKRNELGLLAKFLISYVLSLLLTSLTSFIGAYSGFQQIDFQFALIIIYLLILIIFLFLKGRSRRSIRLKWLISPTSPSTLRAVRFRFWESFTFVCLMVLVILSSYHLYGDAIIGDELYHHGNALLFLSGTYRDNVTNGIPFTSASAMHAYLAGLFSVSATPSLNSFVALRLLSIVPILAFYYFFSKWFPKDRKATLIASVLFTLSSGYGWLYAMSLANSNFQEPAPSAFQILENAGRTTFDIRIPNNFLNNGTLTKPLTVFGLPCGLLLLGLIKGTWHNRILPAILFSLISMLGLMSHEEFALFLLISCMIPIIFKFKNFAYFYLSIVVAIMACILLSVIFPGNSFLGREVLGVPLTFLLLIYVVLMFIAYRVLRLQDRIRLPSLSKLIPHGKKRFVFGVFLILLAAYFYLFTFITWSQLSASEVAAHTTSQGARVVPWYLIPMRSGVVGLLAISYMISRIFKTFEKEATVLLVLGVISFLAGPLYIDFRLSRYMMLVFAVFAALLMIKILKGQKQSKIIANGFIIGLVLVSSGASIILHQGYMALAIENPKIDMFMSHRYMPEGISVFNFLHKNIDLRVDNVAIPNEYLNHFRRHSLGSHFAEEVEGFVGIPFENKLTQGSTAMQSSDLEGLLNIIKYGNIKYLVLPDAYLRVPHSSAVNFAINNFPVAYKDQNYVVLSVPRLEPPSKDSDVSLVFPIELVKSKNILALNYSKLNSSSLHDYRNKSSVQTRGNVSLINYSETDGVILSAAGKASAVWAKSIDDGVNYIEAKFRVLSHNQSSSKLGLLWWDSSNSSYYVYMRPHSLAAYTEQDREFLRNNDLIRRDGIWYDFKIVLDQNTITVYLDDRPELTFPVSEGEKITKVGIKADEIIGEFSQIKTGRMEEQQRSFKGFNTLYNNYYPLAMMSLSGSGYNTAIDGDFALGGRPSLILSFDPDDIDTYLDYVKSGKKLIVLNSNNGFNGGFGDLLGIKPSNGSESFDNIRSFDGKHISLSGVAKNISIVADTKVTSYYYNTANNRSVPFSVEKNIGMGNITYVNFQGYLSSIKDFPSQFLTLNEIPEIIGANFHQTYSEQKVNNVPPIRIIGNMKMEGDVTVMSDSLLFPLGNSFFVDGMSYSTQTDSLKNSFLNGLGNYSLGRVSDLSINGSFSTTVNSSALIHIPSLSTGSYMALNYPDVFNMTLSMSNSSMLRFDWHESEGNNIAFSKQGGNLTFLNVRNSLNGSGLFPLMFKTPDILVQGKVFIEQMYSRKPNDPSAWLVNGQPLNLSGTVGLKVDHIDKLASPTMSRHVTFLKSIDMDRTNYEEDRQIQFLSIPGDISEFAREERIGVPIEEALFSDLNNKLTVAFVILSAVTLYLAISRVKKYLGGMNSTS